MCSNTCTVEKIYNFINDFAPYSLQEGYDNSGINVGDGEKEVKKILLALDVTNEVCDEAEKGKYDLIITHHPVIFRGLKSLDSKNAAVKLVKNDIAAISMHTNFDAAKGGMNDILCEKLGLVPAESLCVENGVPMGYICEYDECTAKSLAERAKKALGCRVVRYNDGEKIVKRVAVCSGSGGSFMKNAVSKTCDAYITGDVKHDIFIDAHNAGLSVIDAGHFYTENIFFDFLITKLKEKFSDIQISKAESNVDVVEVI